ncbi:MAG: CRISPR-associated endonuclease Cas1 [candidate division BRC1 bacterium ADurb.Bin183]|nr:MAG: CRISPR-associated endonuclease Cas1 [candidate division BRC1 bacterium ADurb.Bin183]
MKRLLNTLYVSTQNAYLSREGETVLVRVESETKLRVPIHTLGGIVCFGVVRRGAELLQRKMVRPAVGPVHLAGHPCTRPR